MNRREFLGTAAAASAVPSAFAQKKDTPVANANQMPIVDTHQHLWDLKQFKLAWFDPKTPEGKILGHSFTPKEYAEATKDLNVVKAVYMEVDVDPKQLTEGKLLSTGFIALQAEGHNVDFRNVRLLNLEGCMDPKSAHYKRYYVKSNPAACR